MDDLPTVIVVQILSYLLGKQVFLFKRLSSSLRQIIADNRKYLKHPKISLELVNLKDDDQYIYMVVERKWKKCLFKIDRSDPSSVEIEPWKYCPLEMCERNHFNEDPPLVRPHRCRSTVAVYLRRCPLALEYNDEYYINYQLFKPFYMRYPSERSLRHLFDFVLEKGDINLSIHLSDVECISSLAISIKHCPSPIHHVFTGAKCESFSELCKLLTVIATKKLKSKDFPVMIISCTPITIPNLWSNIRRLNEIATMFRESWLEIYNTESRLTVAAIAMEWRKDPFPLFFFGLRCEVSPPRDLPPQNIEGFEERFKLSLENTPWFYCTILGERIPQSSVKLVDLQNGYRLTFDATKYIVDENLEIVIRVVITAFC